ncbi:hypothetical protein [Ferriphaselus sp. R-1]|uniref:hypothetical protein n=1 Tax=Ferriphaselus sp. R-1 TaxID=1485544 RepID=UPI0012683848|nr:hypothetical protein [Ferriphaselus sp. R-1]
MIITLKSLGVIVSSLSVFYLATNNELALHIGSAILVLLASGILFFTKRAALRAQSLAFLVLTIGVSYATDHYFWFQVWEQGYPWPYSHDHNCSSCSGFSGSIEPFVIEVSSVCFYILATIFFVAVTWQLTHRSAASTNE